LRPRYANIQEESGPKQLIRNQWDCNGKVKWSKMFKSIEGKPKPFGGTIFEELVLHNSLNFLTR
jgi:hypothetical protein